MAHYENPGNEDARRRARLSDAERRAALGELVLRRTQLSESEVALVREVFPVIVDTYHGRVWNQIRRRGISAQDLEDLSQDAFVVLYREIVATGFPDSTPKMLRTITTGLILNHVRDAKRAPMSVALPSSGSEAPRTPPDLDRAMDLREIAEQLFPMLSEQHQDVIEEVVLNGLSHAEAAEVLEIPLGTLKSRVIAAKQKLAAMIEERLPASQRIPR